MAKKGKLIKKLKSKFKLVLINENTFAERFSLSITPLNLLVLFSGIFVLFFILSYLLIAFSPLKQTIPGFNYKKDNVRKELNKMYEDLNKIEKENRDAKEKREKLYNALDRAK